MTGAGTRSCPLLPLCERDLRGEPLGPDEEAALEQHLAAGCPACEGRLEAHLTASGADEDPGAAAQRDLDRLLVVAMDRAARAMEPGQLRVLDRVRDRLRDEEQAGAQRLRRRHLRVAFYLINLAAAVLLVIAYLGTAAAARVQRAAAHTMATETEVKALVTAVARYVRERGELPADMPALVRSLGGPRAGDGVPGPPYYPFAAARLRDGEYLDDFGRPYRYRPGVGRVQIYSLGPDGRDDEGQGDDLGAWVVLAH